MAKRTAVSILPIPPPTLGSTAASVCFCFLSMFFRFFSVHTVRPPKTPPRAIILFSDMRTLEKQIGFPDSSSENAVYEYVSRELDRLSERYSA